MMEEQKLKILVAEPDGTQIEYNTTASKNAHDVARVIGKEGFFAGIPRSTGFRYYPPSRILLITKA